MIKYLLFLTFLASIQGFSQQYYSQQIELDSVSTENSSIISYHLDIDNDGTKEILLNIYGAGLVWYENILDQTSYHKISNSDMENSSMKHDSDLSFKDIDGDGLKDLAYVYDNKVKYQKNLNNGVFQEPTLLLDLANIYTDINTHSFFKFSALDVEDINDDGMNDIIIGLQNQVIIAKKTLNNTYQDSLIFVDNASYLQPTNIEKIVIEDVNNDGLKDIIVTAEGNKYARVHKQTSVFEYDTLEISDEFSSYKLTSNFLMTDFDEDSEIELLGIFVNKFNQFTVGSLDFTNGTSIDPSIIYNQNDLLHISYVDIIGDGKKDIYVNSNQPVVLENTGQGQFSDPVDMVSINSIHFPMSRFYNAIFQDLDSDGDKDILHLRSPGFPAVEQIIFRENVAITNYNLSFDTIFVCNSSYIVPSTGEIITTSTTYADSVSVDSVNIVMVHFKNPDNIQLNKVICDGTYFTVGDSNYYSAGIYENVLINQYGCDSTVSLTLSTTPNTVYSIDTIHTSLCGYPINQHIYTTDTIFTDTLSNAYGCDSLATYHLTFDEQVVSDEDYTKISLGSFVSLPKTLLAVDFDGDSDIDVFSTSSDHKLVYLENTGNEHYKQKTISTSFTNIKTMETFDYGNDGKKDLLLTFENNCSLGVILNTGCGYMDLTLSTCMSNYALGDLDNNGIVDVIIRENTSIRTLFNGQEYKSVHFNNGNIVSVEDYDGNGNTNLIVQKGNLLDIYDYSSKNYTLLYTIILELNYYRKIELADIDNDGDKDVVYIVEDRFDNFFLKVAFLENNQVQNVEIIQEIYRNYSSQSAFPQKFVLGKIAGSSYYDILVYKNQYGSSTATNIVVHKNIDGQNFEDSTLFTRSSFGYYQQKIGDLKIVDLNNDGQSDILYSLNNHSGSLRSSLIKSLSVNADGNYTSQDIANNRGVNFIVNSNHRQMHAKFGPQVNSYMNGYIIDVDEQGGVKLNSTSVFDENFAAGTTIQSSHNGRQNEVDYDLDGDLDIIVGFVTGEFHQFIENHGDYYEAHDHLLGLTNFDYDVTFEDYDLDGDADMIIDKGLAWRPNLGSSYGEVQNIYSWTKPGNGKVLTLVDLDMDGDKDVIVELQYINSNQKVVQIYNNIGSNQLVYHSDLEDHNYLMTKDFNADGNIDMLCDNVWLKNNGNLSFESVAYPNSVTRPQVFKDINYDGYEDVLYQDGSTILWALDDGSLQYSFGQKIVTTEEESIQAKLSLLDFDNDGDLDVLSIEHNKSYIYHAHKEFVNLYENKTVKTYCTSGTNSNLYEWIKKVNFNHGDLVKKSGKENDGYGDYTHKSLTLNIGDNVYAKLKPGYKNGAKKLYWRVWVDWNNDGDFDDAGEKVLQKKGKYTRTGNFTVPSHAVTSHLRMRVAMKKNKFPKSCGIFGRGEVEDYTIKVGLNTSNLKQAQNENQELVENEDIFVINPVMQGQLIFGKIQREAKEDLQLTIVNILGQPMSTHNIAWKGAETSFELPSDHLIPGVYFIRINGSKDDVVKIIVL